MSTLKSSQESLYERIGGIFAIAPVADRFSDAILTNAKLNQNPALRERVETQSAGRLPGLKVMRSIWIAALAGGPFEHTGLPLNVAHKNFRLTSDEFDEVGAEIIRSLQHFEVPDREQKELVDAYMLSKPDVTGISA